MFTLKTYRGHIRNHQKLCTELGLSSELSRVEREKAIITEGYQKWGDELPNHLYGMFSFALQNEKTGEVVCMRDPFGTKPFYYYLSNNNELLYGTYLSDILGDVRFEKEFNAAMLQHYLTYTYVPGEETFFKGVKKLMPGCILHFNKGIIDLKRYFAPTFNPDNNKSLDDWADEIHNTVKQVMTEIKDPDEIAESFLSGGVDSSYVFAMSDAKVSDSCGYEDERFDESPLAKKTAEILNKENNRSVITPEAYFDIVPWVMKNMEQPLGDASAIVFAIGCQETAKHTKLCYSGEGADEFFGGYNMYRNAEKYGENLKNFYIGNTNIMKEEEKANLLRNYDESVKPIDVVRSIYEENEGLDPLSKMTDVDIRVWLEGDIYLNVDKMSTAAKLEVRMPLTDIRVFDIASRIPAHYKVDETQNKVAFRKAASKVLPEDVAYRKKLGFIVPIRYWLKDDRYNADVKRLFASEIADTFFNHEVLNSIFDEYVSGNSDLWRKVWTIYTFLVWYEIYFVKNEIR